MIGYVSAAAAVAAATVSSDGVPLWAVLVMAFIGLASHLLKLRTLQAETKKDAVESVIARCERLELKNGQLDTKIALLEAKDVEQQALIDKLENQRDDLASRLAGALERINSLAEQVAEEKDLKHACRRHMHDAVWVIDLYRSEYGHHAEDRFDCTVWREDKPGEKAAAMAAAKLYKVNLPHRKQQEESAGG